MQRRPIYPHRSVRRIRLSPLRAAWMVVSAAALSLVIFTVAGPLLRFHEYLCQAALRAADVPISGFSRLSVLPTFDPVQAPVVTVPPLLEAKLAGLLGLGIGLLLIVLHRLYPLARSFSFFVATLILVAFGVMVWNPAFQIPSDSFTSLWLRTQTVLWILLPWLSAFLILPIEPSPVLGIGWIVCMGAYGLAWSAVRLAFCLGVMHHTGIVFVTALWFVLGPLSDLIYILVFYSLVVHFAANRLWGNRPCLSQ